jgi:hypothetical protein
MLVRKDFLIMELLLFVVILCAVSALTPFGLRFDGGGMQGMAAGKAVKYVLFASMSVAFGIGFVGLAASGAGAVLGFDGMDRMIGLWVVWLPVLVVATFTSLRRYGI